MELATCPATAAPAPARCEERARRLGQVKFRILEIPPRQDCEPLARESLSSSPARPYRALQAFLSRVVERLRAARP